MRFIPAAITNEEAPGADAEGKVFERLRTVFSGDNDGIGFYKFPVIDKAGERFEREPDFVMLHKEYGLVIIEVKGYHIEHIDQIVGQSWLLQGTSQREAQPFSQARDQGFFIQSHFTREPALRNERGNCKIPINPIVALPNITREEWTEAGHDTSPSTRVLLKEDLTPSALRAELADLPHTDTLSDDVYEAARAVLTGGEVVSGKRGETRTDPQTKREFYQHVTHGLKELDEEQRELGIGIPPGPQQIRGIAGSGKTVLLAMKAAAMHVKHPDWNIALTFHTRSLYEEIEKLVDRFVAHFSDGTRDENLEILHGWGGKTREGFYYKMAEKAGIKPLTASEAKEVFETGDPAEQLGEAAAQLLSQADVPGIYDAILIDEGQDFEPGFYRLCYQALTDKKRLIWAYDEAQNLTNLTAPTPSKIFGADQDILPDELKLTGQYTGGIPKSSVMRSSYRAPRQALMIAHTMGMALKNPEAKIPRITRQDGWRDIGYEVEGDFREVGEGVTLTRPEKFSPHPLQEYPEGGPYVTSVKFEEKDAELSYVADAIVTDLEEEELDPEDILAIPLGDSIPSREFGDRLKSRLDERGIEANLVWQGNSDIFAREDQVTISRIHRAKGNEAAQVYVLNLEEVERDTWQSNPVQNRNELFVALTRSRAWCTVTGSGNTDYIFDELNGTLAETTEPDPKVTFPAPPQRDIDIETEILPPADESQTELSIYVEDEVIDHSNAENEDGISQVYLGDGVSMTGWIPLPRTVVTEKIVPIVNNNRIEDEDKTTVNINFSHDISISGWNKVEAEVVHDQIVPLVREHLINTE